MDFYQIKFTHLLFLLLKDINNCTGPLDKLNELNAIGRSKLTRLRELIDKLDSIGKDYLDSDVIEEAKNHLDQYYK